ncbi:MAG TPA: CBS domain-containing protein [Myxococcaceae bacterium]|jgi:CBS domain-containing protein
MRCKDVMTTLVFRCHEDDPVQKAARLMLEEEVGFIPITTGSGRLAGVITDRDLALRVLAEGKPANTPVCSVMSMEGLLTCRPDDDLRMVARRMEDEQKGRAVVVESGQVVGVISAADLAVIEGPRRAGLLMRALAHRESASLVRS